jgi:hypothetical protein
MPPRTKKSIKNKKGGAEGEISTLNNFTSSRAISPKLTAPAATKAATVAATATATATAATPVKSFFSSKPSASRLLTVPAAASSAATVNSVVKSSSGFPFIRYIIIFIILGFLALSLFMYLEKPVDISITHMFDPLFDFFNKNEKQEPSGVDTLKKTIDEKKVVNNIDNSNRTGKAGASKTGASKAGASKAGASKTEAPDETDTNKYKKKAVVVPEEDDATSRLQMKPKSKSGFCYIGEDRGFRSCIKIGDGDICMSGDIFPTEAICINPNLRE